MSDPSAEALAPRAVTALGVAFGLLLIAGSVAALYFARPRSIDVTDAGGASAPLSASIAIGELPYGLVIAEKERLPFGEEIVRIVDPNAPEEAPLEPLPETAPPAEGEEPPKFDWTKVSVPPADRPPREVTIAWYPVNTGASRVRELTSSHGMALRDLPPAGGTAEIDVGTLVWDVYAPDFVHRRIFRADQSFCDLVRVNLTTPVAYCAMELRWTRGDAGSKRQVEEILKALEPKPAPH